MERNRFFMATKSQIDANRRNAARSTGPKSAEGKRIVSKNAIIAGPLDVWKGNFNGELVVSEPGGTLDGINMEFPETVRYRPGEELVLFLYRTPIGYWRARGYSQGKFPVAAGPDGVRGVRLSTAGLDLADTGKPLAGRARSSISEADGLSLDQFRTRVLGIFDPVMGPHKELLAIPRRPRVANPRMNDEWRAAGHFFQRQAWNDHRERHTDVGRE